MPRNMQHGIVRMGTKIDRKSTMTTAADMTVLTRSLADKLVQQAEARTGSRMCAYQDVARAVGASAVWLRKFIKGYEVKEPGWTIGWNLIDYYNRVCDRVELGIEQERKTNLALKREVDAITATADRALAREAQGAALDEAAPHSD